MGQRKSYKRKTEFKNEKEMHRLMRRYHEDVIADLLSGVVKASDYWHRDWDLPRVQVSRLLLGSGSYFLWTQFNDNGAVVHELEKRGRSNRVVRGR